MQKRLPYLGKPQFLSEYPAVTKWRLLEPAEKNWFLQHGVSTQAIDGPDPVRVVHGSRGGDGRFDVDERGELWFAFPQIEDVIFWHLRTNRFASWNGRCFALNEDIIGEAATYSFDYRLCIYESPLRWLQAERDGIVVVDWSRAFDRLRDAPRVSVDRSVFSAYKLNMKPRRLPNVTILEEEGHRRAAS